nr:hypothetical protein [Oceanococcus sp. HetDA_MAG_MS8]
MTTSSLEREPGTGNHDSVPGSDAAAAPAAAITDAELRDVAISIYQQSGRIPRVTDICRAAGGVRKARAVNARQQVAKLAAEQSLRSWVQMSPAFEARVRALLSEFVDAAKSHCREKLDERLAESDETTASAQANAALLADQLHDSIQQQRTADAELSSMKADLAASEAKLARVRRDLRRFRTLALERKATLDALLLPVESG